MSPLIKGFQDFSTHISTDFGDGNIPVKWPTNAHSENATVLLLKDFDERTTEGMLATFFAKWESFILFRIFLAKEAAIA
jgi:hypothetical protein